MIAGVLISVRLDAVVVKANYFVMSDGKTHDDKPDDPKLSGVRVAAAKCARCGQAVQARFRPFCSQRCADIDLGAWLSGGYRVETNEAPDPDAGALPESDEKP